MSRILQSRYRLWVNKVEVTKEVSVVSFESKPDEVGTLVFSLDGGGYLAKKYTSQFGVKNVIKIQDFVEFEGGAGDFSDPSNYGSIFRGFVKFVRPKYENSGLVTVTVECYDYSYMSAMGKNHYIYPSINTSPRSWAVRDKILLSDIVRGIVSEMQPKMSIGKYNGAEDIRLFNDRVYDHIKPITQKNESDWQILRKLAKQNNCTVWVDNDHNESYLHFVDKSILGDVETDKTAISFLYPAREDKNFMYKDLERNQQIIWDCEVAHDFANMNEVSRTITAFDYQRGEEITIFKATVNEGGKDIVRFYTFEINQAVTGAIPPNELSQIQEIAGSIASGQVSGYTIDDIAKYFVPAKFLNEKHTNFLVDKPYFGITVTFVTDGNVHIVPRKNYMIYGLGRYGSENIEDSYFLRAIKHTWNRDGFLTECEFIK